MRVRALSLEGEKLLGMAPSDAGPAGLRVLSLPDRHAGFLAEAKRQGIPTVALDHAGPEEADLTISVAELRRETSSMQRLSGLKYAIIREEVRALRPAPPGEGALVMIGGGDQGGLGAEAAERIAAWGVPVVLIEGPCRSSAYRIVRPGVTVLHDPPDLPRRLAACRWAVVSGGGSLLEAMYLGKAAYALPQTPGEVILSAAADREGAVLGIGRDALRVPNEIELSCVGAAAAAVVDGRGLQRICEAIEVLLGAPKTRPEG